MSKHDKIKIITSALPYVNNLPHLGNIIGCVLSSDVYYRYCKMNKENCVHICGTDEYGTATEIKAIEKKIHPSELCEINTKKHKAVYDWFNIEFSYFGRTSQSKFHEEVVQDIFIKCYENGYFEEKEDTQFYCEGCELFLADRYVKGFCGHCNSDKARGDQCDDCGNLLRGNELNNPLCAMCDKEPLLKNTKHLYLKLGSLHVKIKDFYRSNSDNWSHNAKNITEQWHNIDLHSRSMTRSLKYNWGIKVPLKGYEDKVFYVWFDAPIGYFSFLKEFTPENYDKIVKGSNTELIQFMGKDNVPFHSIIFPGILIAANENYKLVDAISSTEYLLFENTKFSKSRNVGIFGNELLENNFGTSCYLRYYLIKIRPEEKDANFSCHDYITTIKADVINKLGNFIHRVLNYVKIKLDCELKYTLEEDDYYIIETMNSFNTKYKQKMETFKIRDATKVIMDICEFGNKLIQSTFEPDNKNNIGYKEKTFVIAVSIINHISYLMYPVMPISSEKLKQMIKCESEYSEDFVMLKKGHRISENIEILFKPFTSEQIAYIEQRKVKI